jgi:hypothetical protein
LEIACKPGHFVKATGVGTPLLLSGRNPCSVNQFNTHDSVFCLSAKASTFVKVSSATTVSGLRMQMYSPLAIATPVFPFGKPVILVFNEFYIWKTLFHHFTTIILQLLSTTIISFNV